MSAPIPAQATPSDATRYCRSAGVLERRSMSALLLLAGHDGTPVCLTGTAPLAWELLEQPSTLTEVAAEISLRTGAPLDQVRTDFQPLLAQLVAEALVVVCGQGS